MSLYVVFCILCVCLSDDCPSSCCRSAEQPRRAAADGEQEDEPAGPSRVPEEERHRAARRLPPQDTQPDAHVETAGGNKHTHACRDTTHAETHKQVAVAV